MISSDKYQLTVLMAVNKFDKFLYPSINSILCQNYTDFIFLIICNGSSRDQIKNLITKKFNDHRILIHTLELEGLAFALNYGINLSNSQYIARHDSDDISLPNRLQKQIDYLKHNPDCGVVGSKVDLINEDGLVLKDQFIFVESDKKIRKLLPVHNTLCHPALMFRRDVLINSKGYLFGYFSEDHDLFMRISNDQQIKFHNLNENLFQYRRHANQLTSRINMKTFAEICALHIINIFSRNKYMSIFGIFWVFPPIVYLKRSIRFFLRIF